MILNNLLAIFDNELRANLNLPGVILENTGQIVRDYSLEDGSGYIDYSSLDEDNANEEIIAQIDYFSVLGLSIYWRVFDHDRPSDLGQRLLAHGFIAQKTDALMFFDINTAPGFYWSMNLPQYIQRICSYAGVEDVVRLEEEVWQGKRDWLRKHLGVFLDQYPDRESLYAIYTENCITSAGWIDFYPPSQFARLLGGSTHPNFRRRGYYTALLVTRVREARQRGIRFLTVDASKDSRPILEKLGFECHDLSTVYRWSKEKKGDS